MDLRHCKGRIVKLFLKRKRDKKARVGRGCLSHFIARFHRGERMRRKTAIGERFSSKRGILRIRGKRVGATNFPGIRVKVNRKA